MTGRADDFPRGTGGVGADVDYDLGYDDNGWDTQGFRKPPVGRRGVPADSYRDESYRNNDAFGPDTVGMPEFGMPDRGGTPNVVGTGTIAAPPRRSHRAPGSPRGRGQAKVKTKGSWWRHWTWRKALGVFLGLIGGVIVLVAVTVVYVYNHTPVPTEQMAAALSAQSTVYDANGHVIGRFGNTNRQVVNYNQIPSQIIYSVLAAEDRNFFSEGGVSPTGIMRAAYEDTLGSGDFQGGSTITQEFVRQYYQGIGTSQTASRKVKEIFVAMKIAREKSKQWILENYLNTIYFGQSANGIGAAAQTYFNIPVSKLSTISWSQAALLAAVIQQPSTYPLPQFRSNLETRWQYVRDGLLKMGWINQDVYNKMTFPKFGNYTPRNYGTAVWDPYVMNVVQNELEGIYGKTQSQLDNGGYKIVTTIDSTKMAALYQAVNAQEAAMKAGGEGLQSYMHVGAVLEDPHSGAIEAMYPGPGYPGYKYNGTGKVISQKFCMQIHCEVNLAVYSREQVGSSFKPYILATAVANNMNVQTSMLDGQDHVCIPTDSQPNTFPYAPTGKVCPNAGFLMNNDSTSENGAYNAQDAMTFSINTAYADLWHYVGSKSVVHMAAQFGVNTAASPAGSGLTDMSGQAGMALGQASLTVGEQATMLAAIDNGGTFYHIHLIKSVAQGNAQYALKLTPSHPVFSGNPTTNQNMDTQVQYAMQKVAYSGTAAGVAGMSDGRQIISKTGTTNNAQSAFYIGAIPQEALAVGIFTDFQGDETHCTEGQWNVVPTCQTLNGLGGIAQNFGGTWSASIWHTYAENKFLTLPAQQFPTPVFTGDKWMLAPNSLLQPKKKAPKKQHKDPNNPSGFPVAPSPTAICVPGHENVDCISGPTDGTGFATTPTGGGLGGGGLGNLNTPNVTGAAAGAAVFGTVGGLPFTLFWVRRRERKRRHRRGEISG